MLLTNPTPILKDETAKNSKFPLFKGYMVGDEQNELLNGSDTSSSPPGSSVVDDSESQSPNSVFDAASTSKKQPISATSTTNYPGAISKMVPITGERPIPDSSDSSLSDVLHAVFVILWEQDFEQKGMTVKQLCDLLVEKHPNMANLSTKLSNLVSAKLNSYVKKVEKGEKALKYALSREWSDASPRRMVYVYRGILAPEYHQISQAASAQRKVNQTSSTGNKTKKSTSINSHSDPSLQLLGLAQNQQKAVDFSSIEEERSAGNSTKTTSNNTAFSTEIFGNTELNIPYSSLPVSLGLLNRSVSQQSSVCNIPVKGSTKRSAPPNTVSFFAQPKKPRIINSTKLTNAGSIDLDKDSNILSGYVTAAAAAPRMSKIDSMELYLNSTNHPPNPGSNLVFFSSVSSTLSSTSKSLNLITPVHNAVIKQSPITINLDVRQVPHDQNAWIKTIRAGFMNQEIGSPESVTLDELEALFA